MAKLYVCPCCRGQGVLHVAQGHPAHGLSARLDEEALFECAECEGTGKVTLAHRDELLQWQGKCRTRPLTVAVSSD